MSKKSRHLVTVAITIALMTLWLACGNSGAGSGGGGGALGSPTPSGPPIDVTAADLFQAYQANEVAADQVYRNHRVRVTGTVAAIRRDFMNRTVVDLNSGANMFLHVNATLADSQAARAATLSRGENIVVVGDCSGMVVGSPQIADATIE